MFAQKLTGIPYLGPGLLTWEKVERAIRWLDGESLTGILIDGPDQACLAVAGGNGTYSVDVSLDGITWRHLLNPQAGEGVVEFVAADQRVRMDRRRAATLADTLKAARSFAVLGEIDGTLTWT
jgi:hypothetical protein